MCVYRHWEKLWRLYIWNYPNNNSTLKTTNTKRVLLKLPIYLGRLCFRKYALKFYVKLSGKCICYYYIEICWGVQNSQFFGLQMRDICYCLFVLTDMFEAATALYHNNYNVVRVIADVLYLCSINCRQGQRIICFIVFLLKLSLGEINFTSMYHRLPVLVTVKTLHLCMS